jgi:hypothetical protein
MSDQELQAQTPNRHMRVQRLFRAVPVIASVALALSLLPGPALASTSNVTLPHAASTTQPDIYGCFTWTPTGYDAVAYSGQTVYLLYWNGSGWSRARKGRTTSSGCIRFNDLAVGYYYHLEALRIYLQPLCYYYIVHTGYIGPTQANDTLYRMGTSQLSGPWVYPACN